MKFKQRVYRRMLAANAGGAEQKAVEIRPRMASAATKSLKKTIFSI